MRSKPEPALPLTDAWLHPQWPVVGDFSRVGALMSTRLGGVSAAPFDALNLGTAVGDEPQAVQHNRGIFAEQMPARPVYLKQVHGKRVVQLTARDVQNQEHPEGAVVIEADASVTTAQGVACTVQVADCLPVLFAAPRGMAVAAAHAGWRGLAGGVLQETLAAVCSLGGCDAAQVAVWLGPCICPTQFEVGLDVLHGFGLDPDMGPSPYFVRKSFESDGAEKWLCDLAGLASKTLMQVGVKHISGGSWCTVTEPSRFFSFRRDRITGRMAAAIWID